MSNTVLLKHWREIKFARDKISKFLKIHEAIASCSSHRYLHHLNDMNNNKNLHNLVQIFSNFAHICIDYVLGSETFIKISL